MALHLTRKIGESVLIGQHVCVTVDMIAYRRCMLAIDTGESSHIRVVRLGERIIAAEDVAVTLQKVNRSKCELRIEASGHMLILRKEIAT